MKLTENEKHSLKLKYKVVKKSKQRDKIRAILMLDKRYSRSEISEILLINEKTVTKWKTQYLENPALENFLKDNYVSYSGKLTKEEKKKLKIYVDENIISASKELIEYIEKEFNKSYTESGIVKLLHKLGFVFKKTKLIPSKYDPEAQKKFEEEYEECKKNLKKDEEILFMDGVHPQHNSTCASAWIEKGKMKTIKSNTGRRRININGVYNSATQEILIHESTTINAETTIAFLKEIEKYYKKKEESL